MQQSRKILVLGVGNILLRDEGIGVKVVQKLQTDFNFSLNVELMDGGTLGLRLLDPIAQADHVIVVDAVQNGQEAGTLYQLPAEELEKRVTFKNSLHQLDLVETLAYAEVLGHRPSAIIIGIEPADISPWGTELTPVVENRFDELCSMVLSEIERAGGSFSPCDSTA
jgi:hydrogenase maturation protease